MIFLTAPRLRSGSITSMADSTITPARRPYSIISVSSSSSSSGSSSQRSSACPPTVGTLNLGFEPGDSPRPLRRSVTRTSQCSAGKIFIYFLFSYSFIFFHFF